MLTENIISILEKKYGREFLVFPKEIIFLAGAPGSGLFNKIKYQRKRNSHRIFVIFFLKKNIQRMKQKGITADPIITSDLLVTQKLI
jgi:hypothetical protein